MTIEDIAKITHTANLALCQTQNDFSQPGWENAPEWQRSSAINGVTFHLENPDAKPSDSHDSWLKQKRDEGWKYGPVKDPSKKEHPCFVPYDELPKAQQSKDNLFRGIVHALRDFVDADGLKL